MSDTYDPLFVDDLMLSLEVTGGVEARFLANSEVAKRTYNALERTSKAISAQLEDAASGVYPANADDPEEWERRARMKLVHINEALIYTRRAIGVKPDRRMSLDAKVNQVAERAKDIEAALIRLGRAVERHKLADDDSIDGIETELYALLDEPINPDRPNSVTIRRLIS